MGVHKKERTAKRKSHRMTEIPGINRKLTADRGEKVWPDWVEQLFAEIYAKYKRELQTSGKRRILQNWWIASELFRRTGLMRTARQVSSHLQQRRKWHRKRIGKDANWDKFVISGGSLEAGLVDDACAIDDSDSDSPSTPCSEDAVTLAGSEPGSPKVVTECQVAAEHPATVSHDVEPPSTPVTGHPSPAECQIVSAAPTPIPTHLSSPSPSTFSTLVPAPAEPYGASTGHSSAPPIPAYTAYPPTTLYSHTAPTFAPSSYGSAGSANWQPAVTAGSPASRLNMVAPFPAYAPASAFGLAPAPSCTLGPFHAPRSDVGANRPMNNTFAPPQPLSIENACAAPIPGDAFHPLAHGQMYTTAAPAESSESAGTFTLDLERFEFDAFGNLYYDGFLVPLP